MIQDAPRRELCPLLQKAMIQFIPFALTYEGLVVGNINL